MKNIMDNAEITNKVGNLCVYKCNVCDISYRSKDSLRTHFVQTNHSSHRKSLDLENYLVKTVFHKCQLCSKKIMCERKSLKKHFLYFHHINTVEEYTKVTKEQVEKGGGAFNLGLAKEAEDILKKKTKNICKN